MEIGELFEKQRKLMDKIENEHPMQLDEDRFSKRLLALLVEVGEFTNEWRGFKFWSRNQVPNTYMKKQKWEDGKCISYEVNPLLEEYVDGFHFILELGLEKGYHNISVTPIAGQSTVRQIINIFDISCQFYYYPSERYYKTLMDLYIGLGEMLGFTWDEIVQAYLEKNEVNHERQDQGY